MNMIVVAGPTAVGKTKVAITLAMRLGTEIISADSRQIFREMKIGTARPSAQELWQVPHHLIGSHSITEEYNAATYAEEVLLLTSERFKNYANVILCGGSGLYIKAVCEGFDDIPDIPPEIRQSLNREYAAKGLSWLQQQIRAFDPELYATMDQQNVQRIIRALEVRIATGMSIRTFRNKVAKTRPFDVLKIGLELDRLVLYRNIDKRMDDMIQAGLFEEARELYPYRDRNALRTVGYQEVFDYMEGKYDKDEAIRLLKQHSRRYAKRQMTWFKRDPEFSWFNPADQEGIYDFVKMRTRNKTEPRIASKQWKGKY
jgi:tRNA dimethylallyltransferase